MARIAHWLALAAVMAGFAWVVSAALFERYEQGFGAPDYSIYSKDEYGLGPLVDQLRRIPTEPEGSTYFRPVPLMRPVYLTQHTGLLLIVEPGVEARGGGPGAYDYLPTSEQAARLAKWVASDERNTLVLWGSRYTAIHETLGIELIASAEPADSLSPAIIPLRTAYTEGIDQLMLKNATAVRLDPPSRPHQVLWQLTDKRLGEELEGGALAFPHGRGTVIVIGDSWLLTTEGRRVADNALVITNVAAKHAVNDEILLDEYWHGFQASVGFVSYVRMRGHGGWLIHLAVVATAGIWWAAIRLGPPMPMPAGPRTDAVDYAAAMARIYQGAGVSRWLADVVVRDFLHAVTSHLRLKRTSNRTEIIAAWKKKHPQASEELPGLLQWAEVLEAGQAGLRQMLGAAQRFDNFRRRHLQAERTRRASVRPGTQAA